MSHKNRQGFLRIIKLTTRFLKQESNYQKFQHQKLIKESEQFLDLEQINIVKK
jgi:hypothetical protein